MNSRAIVTWLAIGLLIALLGGCALWQRPSSQPGRTKLSAPLVILPAKTIGGYLIVEVPNGRREPRHFLIDTGSSLTLISPELAEEIADKDKHSHELMPIRVKSARGDSVSLHAAVLPVLKLGGVNFEDISVAIYDTAPISAHLSVKIDGILGFPLFRHNLLTLDYPQSRIVLAPSDSVANVPGTPIQYTTKHRTPIIPVQIGEYTVSVLIDSGSDAAFNLHPDLRDIPYTQPPRPIAFVGTLTGNHTLQVTRLTQSLSFAGQTFPTPIVHITDELTSIGGEILKHFSLTFDQVRSQVSFERDSRKPIMQSSLRGTGLHFRKTPAYWRVVNIVPDSPASAAGLRLGDLVSRLNGESVEHWDIASYDQLLAESSEIIYTLLQGTEESSITLPVSELVP